MSSIFDWIGENAYWIFDGIGVIAITGIIGVIFKKRKNKEKNISIVQKGGKNSVNIQNNNIGSEHDEWCRSKTIRWKKLWKYTK